MAHNLEIDLLRSFAAVAETGSFTSAAGAVARTQSAVSMQIRRLEEIVGQRVFERSSRSLALTPAGETLLGYARRMLTLNDESLLRLSRPPLEGRARIGITEYFLPNELPGLLARFAARHPQVRLEVRMGLSRELRADLSAGRLDAAIVRLAEDECEPIWEEPQVWVGARDWQAASGSPVPLVALPEPCVLRELAIATFRRQRRPWTLAYTGSSMASVQAAVLAGLGVSILGRSSVLPGMQVLRAGRLWPDPGRLRIGTLRGKGAREELVAALEAVTREALSAAGPPVSRGRAAPAGRGSASRRG
jgi:DNA-binding transcriptional LysR family regulator